MLPILTQVSLLKNKFIELSEQLKSNSIDNFINSYLMKAQTKQLCVDHIPQLKVAKEFLSQFPANPGCFCGGCLDPTIFNSKIPFELEVLINCSQSELADQITLNGKY